MKYDTRMSHAFYRPIPRGRRAICSGIIDALVYTISRDVVPYLRNNSLWDCCFLSVDVRISYERFIRYYPTGIVSELFKYIKYIKKHKITVASRDYYREHERELARMNSQA
jgi:hypothetical protein